MQQQISNQKKKKNRKSSKRGVQSKLPLGPARVDAAVETRVPALWLVSGC
jgi:hypothetical protein